MSWFREEWRRLLNPSVSVLSWCGLWETMRTYLWLMTIWTGLCGLIVLSDALWHGNELNRYVVALVFLAVTGGGVALLRIPIR